MKKPATPAEAAGTTVRYSAAALCSGVLLVIIFTVLVVWFRADLRNEIHLKIIERDAAVLYPMALQQLTEGAQAGPPDAPSPLTALLKSSRQNGMLAVAVFDADGNTIESVPQTQLFVELPTEDFLRLQAGSPISRYHPLFPLDQYFAGVALEDRQAPVLEVLLPLPGPFPKSIRGFVRYYIDARPLSRELANIDGRIDRETAVTLLVGAVLIAAVMTGAALSVQRAHRIVAERNERLTRANFELTLSSKASAVGQITSHLIHGLQGSVEGLRSVVASRQADPSNPAWESAAGYTERLQTMIRETIALLGDASAGASYELTGSELAATILERNRAMAAERSVVLEGDTGFEATIDSHRGSLLCLIASNLIQNAVAACPEGGRVSVLLAHTGWAVVLTVSDNGPGIPDSVQKNLFKPGRSGRPGGSGLGLAISQLMARQIGAEMVLLSTGPAGTTFRVTVPLRE
ncbi:MAG TPA: sensor histidine kinase [Opitutaceae bacterium]|jgi:signal transduction histidine kinase|nr:sensor histidine kinase [Opitutaceae bacterium]